MMLCLATRKWEGWQRCMETMLSNASDVLDLCIVTDEDVVPAYQKMYEMCKSEILAFIHDDVEIFEKGWDKRVEKEFNDPTVGLVGFGGALGHGQPYLYRVPYHLPDLARQEFMSNMREAEVHGTRFTGERDVAVIDGFSCIVRRSILEKANGFPINQPYGYYMWCEWLCCEVRRQGFKIRLVGIDCNHIGGRTSTISAIKDNYEAAHKHFYDNNRDMMPYRV